jgi:vacuolar-type H+-ATPase catalytic subunit A/Vma1
VEQLSPAEIIHSPYVLIGSVAQLAEDLQARRRRWSISYYVVLESYMEALAPIIARLVGT